jgi:hypothetical protein
MARNPRYIPFLCFDELMNACWNSGRSRCNLPNRQPQFMGGFDCPHPLDLGIGKTNACPVAIVLLTAVPVARALRDADAAKRLFRKALRDRWRCATTNLRRTWGVNDPVSAGTANKMVTR